MVKHQMIKRIFFLFLMTTFQLLSALLSWSIIMMNPIKYTSYQYVTLVQHH